MELNNNDEHNNDRRSKGGIHNNNISKSKGRKSYNKSISSCEYEVNNKSSNESVLSCESEVNNNNNNQRNLNRRRKEEKCNKSSNYSIFFYEA